METGAGEGQWTLARYRRWLAERRSFHTGAGDPPPDEPEQLSPLASAASSSPVSEAYVPPRGAFGGDTGRPEPAIAPIPSVPRAANRPTGAPTPGTPVVIDDDGLGLDDLIRQIERRR